MAKMKKLNSPTHTSLSHSSSLKSVTKTNRSLTMPNSKQPYQGNHKATMQQVSTKAWTGQPYPAYKDSGIEWLGRVPEHWETGMVKRGYDIKLGKMLQTKPNSADDIEVSYLKAKNVQWFSVQTISEVRMWASPGDIEQFSVSSGDLLVCEGGEGGRCGILTSEVNGHIIQNSLHRVQPRDGNSNTFLQYTMSAIAKTGWFVALNNKATIAHFTYEKFGALHISFPSPLEQHAIAHFLDHATQRIQRHIQAKQKLIKLLEEQKQVIIHQAVTGQINIQTGQPYPAYKDSGVDWLRRVPEHWEVRRNGWLFSERSETGYGSLPILEVSLHKGVVIRDMEASGRKQQMSERDRYKRAKKGDIAYNTMRMWQGAVGVVPADGLVSPAYVVLKPIDRIESDYYEHLFSTGAYKRVVKNYSRGIVSDRDRLYWDEFKRIKSVVPSIGEQTAIAHFLNHTTQRIAKHRAAVKREIDLLHEYRTRLIADVVTGKLDVREAAAHLPKGDPLPLAANCQDGTELADPGRSYRP